MARKDAEMGDYTWGWRLNKLQMKQNLYDFNHHCGMNHKKYLEALYGSLYGEGRPEAEMETIYVDNCSTDGRLTGCGSTIRR